MNVVAQQEVHFTSCCERVYGNQSKITSA